MVVFVYLPPGNNFADMPLSIRGELSTRESPIKKLEKLPQYAVPQYYAVIAETLGCVSVPSVKVNPSAYPDAPPRVRPIPGAGGAGWVLLMDVGAGRCSVGTQVVEPRRGRERGDGWDCGD